MGENDRKITSASFVNLETGEEVISFEDVGELGLEQNISASEEVTFRIPASLSLSFDGDESSERIWRELATNSEKYTVEFDGYLPILVQAKTNKKSRINKKWLKRYGTKVAYKKVRGRMLECSAETYPTHVEITSDRCILR